jgi:hypothetical protein
MCVCVRLHVQYACMYVFFKYIYWHAPLHLWVILYAIYIWYLQLLFLHYYLFLFLFVLRSPPCFLLLSSLMCWSVLCVHFFDFIYLFREFCKYLIVYVCIFLIFIYSMFHYKEAILHARDLFYVNVLFTGLYMLVSMLSIGFFAQLSLILFLIYSYVQSYLSSYK